MGRIKMNNDWTNIEVDLIVADYFSMLEDELHGKPVNKTLHRNGLKILLNGRSDGSIEFKHQNISAVLIKLGLPFIKGYKPKWNYQQILEDLIINYISQTKPALERTFNSFAEGQVSDLHPINFSSLVEQPPVRHLIASEPNIPYDRKPIKINYLAREQGNTALGILGEELVINYERWRLVNLGKESLADRIEWVSKFDDGAGFDILSRNENGSDRYIEVKTTKLSKETPIFFTKNEYEFSLKFSDRFHLYRLFNFNEQPRMFNLKGSFDHFCSKEAIQYKGYF